MLSDFYCDKCAKQMTIREAASHNMIADYSQFVCYRCYRNFKQDIQDKASAQTLVENDNVKDS